MTHYTRGRALEYEVKKKFENDGYLVLRAAGSHGPADLIALSPGHVKGCGGRCSCASDKCIAWHGSRPCIWLIQCKIKDTSRTNAEKKAFIKLAQQLHVHAAWCSRNLGRVNLWL